MPDPRHTLLQDGHIVVATGAVLRRGRDALTLAPREREVLRRLVESDGAVERDALVAGLGEGDGELDHRALDHVISRLRAAIEKDPRRPSHILTERGRGYRWVAAGVGAPRSDGENTSLITTVPLTIGLQLVARGVRPIWLGVPGCGAGLLTRALGDFPSPQTPSLPVAVGPLTPDESARLLSARLAGLSVPRPSETSLAHLVAASGGHPWTLCRIAERAVFLPPDVLATLAAEPLALLDAAHRRALREAFARASDVPVELRPEPLFSAAVAHKADP